MATKIITDQIQSHNGLLTLTLPVKDGAANSTLVTDGNGNLSFAASDGSSSGVVGQAFYGSGDGSYIWTCPPGVTSVCVVCIGGGSASNGSNWASGGGGGGGLGWKNDIPVTPGKTYDVVVGKGGNGVGSVTSGSNSYFIDTSTVYGGGGSGYAGGGYGGTGGGNGGSGSTYGGGGAGGYNGAGGGQDANGSGGGGAGGGSYSSTYGGGSGGGTGPFGQGASGSSSSYAGGGGGSGGEGGMIGENPWWSWGCVTRPGGLYGGGGGGPGSSGIGQGMQRGGRGCVRIIWGEGRKFPSTGTGDM